jgi:hypothetical protein
MTREEREKIEFSNSNESEQHKRGFRNTEYICSKGKRRVGGGLRLTTNHKQKNVAHDRGKVFFPLEGEIESAE